MADRIAATSKEAVLVDHYTEADPTSSTVKFAFLATDADPPDIADAVWTAGTWSTSAVLQTRGEHDGRYLTTARIVIGPGSSVGALTEGRWRVWTWIDGSTTDPVKRAGDIVIY